jgi:hypothetical protein
VLDKNFTFITSNSFNIRKCLELQYPIALTIIDDYMYLADIVTDKAMLDAMRKKDIFVGFMSAASAGFITS